MHDSPYRLIYSTCNLGSQNKCSHMADGAPHFLSFQKLSTPVPPPFQLPTLYRTEDYFPADAGEAAPQTPAAVTE